VFLLRDPRKFQRTASAAFGWRPDARLLAKISRHGLLALQEVIAASAKGRSRNQLADWA
jgi:hypothetical protein